jgi:hypothetical protein
VKFCNVIFKCDFDVTIWSNVCKGKLLNQKKSKKWFFHLKKSIKY